METVADLHLLEFAKRVVELGQRLILVVVVVDAAVVVEAGGPAQRQDLLGQQPQPARIHSRGLVVFVDQLLQIAQRAVALGAGHRRGQVVDDHRLGSALGLGAFAGIVDDERVEMGKRTERRLGEAFGGQRQRLAWQPF